MQRVSRLRIRPAAGPARIGAPGGATSFTRTDPAGCRSSPYRSSRWCNEFHPYGSGRPPVQPVLELPDGATSFTRTDLAGRRSSPSRRSRWCNEFHAYGSGRPPVHPVLELPVVQRVSRLRIRPAAGPSRIGAPGGATSFTLTDPAGRRSIPYWSSRWCNEFHAYGSGRPPVHPVSLAIAGQVNAFY